MQLNDNLVGFLGVCVCVCLFVPCLLFAWLFTLVLYRRPSVDRKLFTSVSSG